MVFVILIYLISLFVQYEERFSNDFDKVLDNKCKLMTSNRLNNYIGPWDGSRMGSCGTYRCPVETCSFLEKDRLISPNYGTNNYKWSTQTSEQTMSEVNGNVRCASKHDTIHPIHGTTLDCSGMVRMNDHDHGEQDFCYEYYDNKWNKVKYIKLMDNTGTYYWRKVSDLGTTISQEELNNCRKEPVNCANSNVYCCKLPGHPNPCYNRLPNTNDQQIMFYNNPLNPTECITDDVCGVVSCFQGAEYRKNCWQFNTFSKNWTNHIFSRKFVDGVCGFYDSDNVRFDEAWYTDGFCRETEPEFTNEKCAIDNTPITCDFLNENEDLYSKTYQSTLNLRGDRCIYETETGDDVLISGLYRHPINGYPLYLSTNNLCPMLTPASCKDNEHFLKIYPDIANAAPECMPCPEGTYRNDQMNVWDASTACSPNAVCPLPSECDESNPYCQSCLKSLNSDPNGDKYERIYLETRPNKSNCDIVNDDMCVKKSDGSYRTCRAEHLKVFGDKKFCDNCSPGYKLDLASDGSVECKRVIQCTHVEKKCMDNDGYFKDFEYINDTDEFSPCVWKEIYNAPNTLNQCISQCEEGKYRVDDYCSSVVNTYVS